MLRLLYPLMACFYVIGGVFAGPFIGWRCFQQNRKEWEGGQ